jgi:putative PIN family toxin of toxin-antitoxin system
VRVVVDANIAISAAINGQGPSARILRAWEAGLFTWITSDELLRELERAIRYPRVVRRWIWTEQQVNEYLYTIRSETDVVATKDVVDIVQRDPDDNRLVEAALAGEADYIVTGDSALLELAIYQGIQIVTPARFVAILATTAS